MKWLDRLSLLVIFCGSFLLFWIVYSLINLSAGFLALGPEGSPTPVFLRVMEFLAHTGAALTGSVKQDTAFFRATTVYALIFAVAMTVRSRKKMLSTNDESDRQHDDPL